MEKTKEDRAYKEFGTLLKALRERTGLSQTQFLNSLTYLIQGPDKYSLDDSAKRKSAQQLLDDLKKLNADIELNEGGTLLYNNSNLSRYENGHIHVERERVLLFIYFFKQKKAITLEEADRLLTSLNWKALEKFELKIIFGDELREKIINVSHEEVKPEFSKPATQDNSNAPDGSNQAAHLAPDEKQKPSIVILPTTNERDIPVVTTESIEEVRPEVSKPATPKKIRRTPAKWAVWGIPALILIIWAIWRSGLNPPATEPKISQQHPSIPTTTAPPMTTPAPTPVPTTTIIQAPTAVDIPLVDAEGNTENSRGAHVRQSNTISSSVDITQEGDQVAIVDLINSKDADVHISQSPGSETVTQTAALSETALTIPTATPTITPLSTTIPLAFATQSVSETLIVIATFHNTAVTNSEAHAKIRRTIASEATNQGEQNLRVEVEPTELKADQRNEAEALGKRYNASMVIWGEDTGVEVIVNFLNLKEHDLAATSAIITETERSQLADPNAYAHFITRDLPQEITFFAFFAIGQSYYLNKQYDLAIKRIEAAIVRLPPDAKPVELADAYFRLGWLYQHSTPKNLQQAIDNLDKAVELKPDYEYAYNSRGIAYKNLEQYDKAIADYNKAIELDPNDPAPYYNRGNVYKNRQQFDKAITDYSKAIELDPAHQDAYRNRGIAYKNQEKYDKAIDDYNKAIELDPNDVDAYYNRGIAHDLQNKPDEAIADYSKAIELEPSDADTYYNRGRVYKDQDKFKEAIADYSKAIELKPDYEGAYHSRGIAYKNLEQYDKAITDYNKAIELDPNDANAYYNRGIAYDNQDKFAEAIADYRQYLQLSPNADDRTEVEQWITEAEAKLTKQKQP